MHAGAPSAPLGPKEQGLICKLLRNLLQVTEIIRGEATKAKVTYCRLNSTGRRPRS